MHIFEYIYIYRKFVGNFDSSFNYKKIVLEGQDAEKMNGGEVEAFGIG